MGSRVQVLQSYKSLLKAAGKTFNGDIEALQSVKEKIRWEFNKCKNCDASLVPELLEEAKSAENFIRGIVQAKMNDQGNYELRVPEGLPSNPVLEPFVQGEERISMEEKTSCCGGDDGKSDCCAVK